MDNNGTENQNQSLEDILAGISVQASSDEKQVIANIFGPRSLQDLAAGDGSIKVDITDGSNDRSSLDEFRNAAQDLGIQGIQIGVTEDETEPGTSETPRKSLQERMDENPELKALVERAKLMNFPALRHLLEMARRDPDMHSMMDALIGRKDDLLKDTFKDGSDGSPKELHRTLAPLFSAMYLHSRFGEYLDMTVSEWAQYVSDELKDDIRSGKRVVPISMIGAGWHSSVIQNEIMSRLGTNPLVTFDEASDIGGTFWLSPEAFWYLNSRQRPTDINERPIPGTKGDINPQGRGLLGGADITTTAYPDSQAIGRVIRTNFMNAGHAVLDMKLQGIYINDDRDYNAGLRMSMRDQTTGTDEDIYTDEINITSGLGEDIFRYLDRNDLESRTIIEEELEKFFRGETPAVMTGEMKRIINGEKGNRFPNQDFREGTVYIGWGDETRIHLEHDFGHGPGRHLSTQQMDFMGEVTIIASNVPLTKEEAAMQERPRYAENIVDFPRVEERYFSRIKPLRGKGVRLRRNPDNPEEVNIIYEDETGLEQTASGRHVVFNTGFEDKTAELLQNLPIRDTSEIRALAGELRDKPEQVLKPGTTINYRGTARNRLNARSVEVTAVDLQPGQRKVTLVRRNGGSDEPEPEEFFLENERDRRTFATTFFNTDENEVRSVQIPGRGPALEVLYDFDEKTEIGKRAKGYPIKIFGPAAMLQPTDQDKEDTSAFDLAKENVAAAFFYEPKDRIFGEELSDEIRDGVSNETGKTYDFEGENVLRPSEITYQLPEVTLEAFDEDPEDRLANGIDESRTFAVSEEPFSDKVSSGDVIRWQLRKNLEKFNFPDDFPEELLVTIQRTTTIAESDEFRQPPSFIIKPDVLLPRTRQYFELLNSFTDTGQLSAALHRIADTSFTEPFGNLEQQIIPKTDREGNPLPKAEGEKDVTVTVGTDTISGPFEITVPIIDGKADTDNILLRNSYRTEKGVRYHTL